MLVVVIGRGHGGTRLASFTLSKSGVYMGKTNSSGDMVPATQMYKAVKLAGPLAVKKDDGWDFSNFNEPPNEFKCYVNEYVKDIMKHDICGWKLPETVLAFPWIIQMFPEAYYINWIRSYEDNVCKPHLTDDLRRWNIDSDGSLKESWQYQREIVTKTNKPKNFLEINFEDFVLNQDEAIEKISDFIGIKLQKIPVIKEKVGQWKK